MQQQSTAVQRAVVPLLTELASRRLTQHLNKTAKARIRIGLRLIAEALRGLV